MSDRRMVRFPMFTPWEEFWNMSTGNIIVRLIG
jgi:hypothetical protein